MELNKIYCTDVLDGLRGLDNESVDVIITSPPYNKRGLNKGINNPKSKWVCTIDYNGDGVIESKVIATFKSGRMIPFKIRQEIIWDRGSTNNVATCRYLPSTELIFWLTKDVQPNFYRGRDTIFKKEVWPFPFKTNTAHPAPFPIDLPDNILHCIPKNEDGTPLIVLDPFMGSGTVAVSAINHGCDYIGFEKFQTYVDMANERIATETKNERP